MTKLIASLALVAGGMLLMPAVSSANHTSASALTYYLHYEGGTTDCTGDFYMDDEDYPDPGHSCAALEQQVEPVEWVPETFTPTKLDTTRKAIAQLAVTGAAFDRAALRVRLFGVRADGQKMLVGRAASSEFSSDLPAQEPVIPDLSPETHQVTLFFSLRQTAKDATFTTVSLETDLMGFAPGAYIQLDNPASSLTIPTIQDPATTCSRPCVTPQPTPPV